MSKILSLYELAAIIQEEISYAFERPVWVKAELVKMNYYPQSGHCFPELVEKEGNKIKAQIRATIWSSYYPTIASKFKMVTGNTISPGMQLLFLAQVSFHPIYGLSLQIIDIDPQFSLGAMAYEKQMTIKKLEDADVINRNKSLPMPLLLKRLAIISAASSKGFNDFIQTMNESGYTFNYKIFPAVLQGDTAIASQISAFEEIKKDYKDYDAAIIIRGGGGEIGMNCYDNYNLAYEIATFPIPVITGIGHSTDSTIADMVAAASMKTPTETANFIIDKFKSFEDTINTTAENIIDYVTNIIGYSKKSIEDMSSRVVHSTTNYLNYNSSRLLLESSRLESSARTYISNQMHLLGSATRALKPLCKIIINNQDNRLNIYESRVNLMDPHKILKRGFSITTVNGKAVKSTADINVNDTVSTVIYEGDFLSKVTRIIKDE